MDTLVEGSTLNVYTQVPGKATSPLDPPVVTENSESTLQPRRTRRPGPARIHPQNIYGRNGRPRCANCRKSRQRCEYQNKEEDCQRCKMLGRQCGVKLLPPTLQAKIDASGTINQSSQAQDVPMASVIQLKLMCPFPDIERISDSDDDLLRRYLIRTEYDWREYHGNTLILGIEWPFDFDRNSLVVSSKVTRVSAMISSLFFEADGTVVNEIGPTYFQACYNTLQKLSTRDLDERSFVALYLLAMTLTIFEWHLAETLACFKALHSLLDLLHQSLTPTRAKPLFNAWEVALSHYLSLVVSRVRHRGKMDTETTEVAEWLASVIMGGKVGVLNNNAYGYGNQVILLLLWCCHRTELDSSSSPQIAACLQVASAEVKNHVIRIKLSDISSNVQPYHYITYAANLIIRFISATTEEAWKGQEVYSMAEEMWAFSERLLAGDLGDSLWDNHKSHSSDDNEILPSDSEEGETMTESSGDLPDSGEALSDDNDKEEVIREFSKVRIFYTSPTPTTFREIFGGELSCFRILGFFMAGLIFSSASNPGGRTFDNRYQNPSASWTAAAEVRFRQEGHARVLETS